jgi:hypothetical protein
MKKIKPKTKKYYEWSDLEKAVENLSGRELRDWCGKYSNTPSEKDFETGNYPEAIWAKEQGYDWTVLNDNPDGSERTPQEIALRVKICEEYEKVAPPKLPYQDFWHYCLDHVFYDVNNGCFRYFNPSQLLEDLGDKDLKHNNYVKEVLSCFVQVFKENNLPDEIEVYIWW